MKGVFKGAPSATSYTTSHGRGTYDAKEHLEDDAAEAPQIDLVPVRLVKVHLWGDVSGRPRIRRRTTIHRRVRKSKVRNDDVTTLDEEVFGLEVTMDNAGVVEEEDTSGLMKN